MKSTVLKACIILIIISALMITMGSALTMTVDGDLTDWGLAQLNDPSSDWSKNETWLPSQGISFRVEDNFNPLSGDPYHGVHIQGTGSSYSFYNEPQILQGDRLTWEPYGRERYDLEAIYFTQDAQKIYLAIITSIAQEGNPPAGGDRWPGDLGLNFRTVPGEEFQCEYGVKINIPSHYGTPGPSAPLWAIGDIVFLPNWEGIGSGISPAVADIMKNSVLPGGGKKGTAEVKYVKLDHIDHPYPYQPVFDGSNYVIEISIPKAVVGVTTASIYNIQYNDNCMNDQMFVPEFPAFSLLIGLTFGLAGVIFVIRTRDSREK